MQVPLFETLDDLYNAPGTIDKLLSNEWYLNHIKGKQECMIGACAKMLGRYSVAGWTPSIDG